MKICDILKIKGKKDIYSILYWLKLIEKQQIMIPKKGWTSYGQYPEIQYGTAFTRYSES